MGLMTNYLIKTSNAEDFLNAIRNAKAPERFTQSFLKDLEFGSSNDRLWIGVLKGLRFLDDNGGPTERYFAFLDQSVSGIILAEAIRDAYEDLFAINKDAQNLDVGEVQGKFRTLTRGAKSDNVINWMANTFRTLSDLADWSRTTPTAVAPPAVTQTETRTSSPQPTHSAAASNPTPPPAAILPVEQAAGTPLQLHYNIQLLLPDSRDPAVFDALFSSLRRHLL